MKTLLILNDPPYGSERTYNGLRLAHALLKLEPAGGITVFLMADAVVAARKGQKTPDGYYNMERMLKRVLGGDGAAPQHDGRTRRRDGRRRQGAGVLTRASRSMDPRPSPRSAPPAAG
jgi:hypothetical protein